MVAPLLLSSCLKNDDEVFDESSSNRLTASLKETQKILMDAENGWLMDYYMGENYKYGGYAYFVKFDSLTVTASSELHGDKECTSYYKMTTDNGPVLSFDTYNDVLHDYSTPTQDMPEAYHADFEFTVMKATPELITLRGKRTGNTCYLRPFNGDRNTYVAAVDSFAENIIISTIKAEIEGYLLEGELDLDARGAVFAVMGENGLAVSENSYTYTDKGIRLCHPLKVGDKTLQDFSFDLATDQLACVETENAGIVLKGGVPEGYVKFDEFAGDYYYKYLLEDRNGYVDTVNLSVSLIPSEDKTYYTMTGFSKAFDVVVNYNKSKGCLMMYTQKVGTYNSNTVYLQAANLENGLAPGNTEFGMMTEWDMTVTDKTIYKWVTIPNDYFIMDSWCMWMLDGNNESAGQLYGDEAWTLGTGQYLITDILWLEKK